MIVNIFFDSDDIADIVYVPDDINLSSVQNDFFDWLFNKEIDHDYWVYVEGEKSYCQYGTDEFLVWLNRYVLDCEKAKVLEKNSKDISMDNPCLYF